MHKIEKEMGKFDVICKNNPLFTRELISDVWSDDFLGHTGCLQTRGKRDFEGSAVCGQNNGENAVSGVIFLMSADKTCNI